VAARGAMMSQPEARLECSNVQVNLDEPAERERWALWPPPKVKLQWEGERKQRLKQVENISITRQVEIKISLGGKTILGSWWRYEEIQQLD